MKDEQYTIAVISKNLTKSRVTKCDLTKSESFVPAVT